MRHNKSHNHLIVKAATKVARYSDVHSAKVAAVAFSKSGKIIASAQNRGIFGNKRMYTEHAEEGVLRKLHRLRAFDRFDEISILVLRINTYGIMMAKPCQRCRAQFDKLDCSVYYTKNGGQIAELK